MLGEHDEGLPHLELSSTTAIKEAVAVGAGAGVLSILAVEQELRDGRLVRVPVRGVDLRRQLRAVWLRSAILPEPATVLLETAAKGC